MFWLTFRKMLQPTYRGPMSIETGFDADDPGSHTEGPKTPPMRLDSEDNLLDAEDVAAWLKVSVDWVWDHAGRRARFYRRSGFRTARFAFGEARLPSSSMKESACPRSAGGARKMWAGPIVPATEN